MSDIPIRPSGLSNFDNVFSDFISIMNEWTIDICLIEVKFELFIAEMDVSDENKSHVVPIGQQVNKQINKVSQKKLFFLVKTIY